MIGKRSTLWLLISGLALLLTGCVWLRLLAFKEQLADLDRYVKVDDRNGLAFHFLEPVLYADDVRELLQMEPTVKTTNQNCQTWLWTFEKELAVTNAEPANFDLTFATLFENRKFNELGIPERFTAVIPKPIILGIVRSLGHADIDRSKRSASVRWDDGGSKGEIRPLTKAEITGLLGAPLSVTDSNLTYSVLYKYSLKTASPASAQDRLAWARFTFSRDRDEVVSIDGLLAGMRFTFLFEPPKAAPKPAG